jgi:hypothetical protein
MFIAFLIVTFGLGYILGFALRGGLSRLRRSRVRREFTGDGERAAWSAEQEAAESLPRSGDADRVELASRLGARLEAVLTASSLLWVDIREGGRARSNGTLIGSFQLDFTDRLRLRLVRANGSAFAEWDLRDFDLSLADAEVFGRHVVLTGHDEVSYSFPALPHEDAELLLGILTEAREVVSAGPPAPGEG